MPILPIYDHYEIPVGISDFTADSIPATPAIRFDTVADFMNMDKNTPDKQEEEATFVTASQMTQVNIIEETKTGLSYTPVLMPH